MGDRGNIVVRTEQTPAGDVWFYTHWRGSEIGEVCKTALARKWRWNDPSYLARIVFDELCRNSRSESTGFGISTECGDNEHMIVVIDVPRQVVCKVQESQLKDGRLPTGIGEGVPFSEFIT